LPIEQTNESTAMSGPAITFSIVFSGPGASVRNRLSKKPFPS
jgi:hypothetical protein